MNSRRVYVYFVLTFVLGALAGAAGAFFYGKHMIGPEGKPALRERILKKMTRELNLNADQAAQVRTIMEETGQKLEELRAQRRPERDAVLAESRDRIRKVLTPEQAPRFDEMVRKFEERRNRSGPAPPPRE